MSVTVSVEMIGPFEHVEYQVSLDGFRVPYLRAWPNNPQHTEWTLLLDGRLSISIPADHLTSYVSFLADAMAIAAGYGAHSHACAHQGERHNPFGTQLLRLDPGAEGIV